MITLALWIVSFFIVSWFALLIIGVLSSALKKKSPKFSSAHDPRNCPLCLGGGHVTAPAKNAAAPAPQALEQRKNPPNYLESNWEQTPCICRLVIPPIESPLRSLS